MSFTDWVDERIAKAVPLVVNATMDRLETRLDRAVTELKDEMMRVDNKLTDVARQIARL